MLLYILHTHRVKEKNQWKLTQMHVVDKHGLQHYTFVPGHLLPAGLEEGGGEHGLPHGQREQHSEVEEGWNDAKEKKIHTVWTRDEEGAPLNPREKAAEKQRFPGFTAGAASEGLHWQPVSPRNEFNTLLIIDAHQNTGVTHTWWECIHFLLDDSFSRGEPSICW